jgi:hypothetical protein
MPPPPTRTPGLVLEDPPYTYRLARAVQEIQEEEDRRILELLDEAAPTYSTGGVEDGSGLTLESLREVFNQIDRQGLRSLAPMLSRQEYEDILALYDPSEQIQILPVTVPRDFVESGILPGDQLQVEGLPGAFTVHTHPGCFLVNPRGVGRLDVPSPGRVQFPEFEIQSSPMININEIRSRRFNLIDRGGLEPAVQRILDAVIRAKLPPIPRPIPQSSSRNNRSIWEALVDLDLVDVSSA